MSTGEVNFTHVRVRRGSAVHEFVAALEQVRKVKPGQQAVKMLVVDEMSQDFEVVMGAGGVEPPAQPPHDLQAPDVPSGVRNNPQE
jgi:hypothetical protein